MSPLHGLLVRVSMLKVYIYDHHGTVEKRQTAAKILKPRKNVILGKVNISCFRPMFYFYTTPPPSENVNKNSGFLTFSGDKELQHYLSELNRLVFLFTFIIQNCNNYSPIYNMITVCSTIINVYNNCKSGDRDAPINILTHSDYLINTSDVKCNVSPVQNY